MIDYKVYVNNGNEALGVDKKTITVNEDVRTADEAAMAREIHHENTLIPEQVAQAVLQNFCKAAANLMSMGFCVQLRNGNDVALRIHPDLHLEGGNMDLERAKQIMPDDIHTEEDMVKNAGELVSRVGVSVKVAAECQPKFSELLMDMKPSVNRNGIVERARVNRKDSEGGETASPDPSQGGDNDGDDTGGGGGNHNDGGDDD